MVSTKALAAIALTLIICAPIGLGYALSMENEDVTAWKSTEENNISDSLLNSQYGYAVDYTSYNNNRYLSDGLLRVPVYAEVSTTFSPYQQYTESLTANASAGTTNFYTLTSSESISDLDTGASIALGERVIDAKIATTSTVKTATITLADDTVLTLNSTYTAKFLLLNYTGQYDTQWAVIYRGTTYYTSGWMISGENVIMQVTLATGNDLQIQTDYAATEFQVRSTSILQVTKEDGTTDLYLLVPTVRLGTGQISDYATSFMLFNNSLWMDGENYGYYGKGTVTLFTNSNYYTYDKAKSGIYGDVAAGWILPDTGSTLPLKWFNGFTNEYATFYVQFRDSGSYQEAYFEINGQAFSVSYHFTEDTWVVAGDEGVNLGNYPVVQIKISKTGVTFTGVSSMPAWGAQPNALNSKSFDMNIGKFTQITMKDTYNTDVIFRCDVAGTVTGEYPITENFTYNDEVLFPSSDSYTIELNSIAIYGSSLSFAGETYAVTDGKITVDGTKMSVKGLEISSWKQEDGTWENRLKTTVINSTDAPATLYFGGEWSLTAQRFTMEETTESVLKWQPGEFAFSKEDFVACGLLVCGAAFLALGLTGRANGGKALLLALICGGAGLGYLTLL